MAGVPLVQVELLVQWGAVPAGALLIAANDADLAVGTIGANDADVAAGWLSEPLYTATFGGPYDDLSSVFRQGGCQRGRNDDRSQTQAATASFIVRDPTGKFNWQNPASPLYGQIETMMHPIRWRIARAGVWQTKFFGYTQRITWQPTVRKGVTQIDCVDLFYVLGNLKPVIGSIGATTTGAAIGRILDAIGWPATARVLDVGDNIPDFHADGTRTCLDLLGDLLTAERGDFFIRGDGIPVYQARYSRYLEASTGTVIDRMTDHQPEVDFDLVRNKVTVNLTDFAGNILHTGSASNAASIAAMGEIDADTISTPYLGNNAQADSLAAWLVNILAEPTPPARNLILDGRQNDLVDLILALELANRISVSSRPSYAEVIKAMGPTLYWRLNELDPSKPAEDRSGFDNEGVYGAGVTLGQPAAVPSDTATAALFNNTSGALITSSYPAYVAGSSRTFMGWAKRLTNTDLDMLITGNGPNTPTLFGTTTNDIQWRPDVTAGAVQWNGVCPLGSWFHWALTYNDATKTAELFINGVSQGAQVVANGYGATPGTFEVSNPANTWNGGMQDVAVFPTILTAAQIAAAYASAALAGYFVEQLQLTVTQPGRIAGSYALSKAPTDQMPLLVAANDADLAVGTIGANDADTAAGVLVY